MDYETNDRLELLARDLNYRLGAEARQNILFNLNYSMDYA